MAFTSQYSISGKIRDNAAAVLFRGFRNTDHAPVLIKLLKGEPERSAQAKLRNEAAILEYLDVVGVIKTYGLEGYGRSLALILVDPGGEVLDGILTSRRLPLEAALRIAASVAGALEAVHREHVIHKNITPQNILVAPEAKTSTLMGFGMAARLSRNTRPPAVEGDAAGTPEGNLAYMSPEQTGRMNRSIDRRTDFYSLGITLYEMLTGVLPFQTSDPMELVHSHIARYPIPPHQLSPEIPELVSELTMKLLAKAAEDRYQSAYGLRLDLEECLAQLSTAGVGRIVPFSLGLHDRAGELQLPQKLYGREQESVALAGAWERVSGGASELLLISGHPGVGKSALVEELHHTVARRGGHFIGGKFDQLNRSVPYAAVADAFRELIRQLLTEPAEVLARIKRDLLAALSSLGQILIDIIPELKLIVGPQPNVPVLGPTESQNRFALVFQSFIRVIAVKERPLAVFLDDLQWVDPGSARLLELLLLDTNPGYLLVLGAYRDVDVVDIDSHALRTMLDELRDAGATVSEIKLKPLSLQDVYQVVADALSSDDDQIQPLAELVWSKTHGNPFYLSQFLHELCREGLLTFDAFGADSGAWTWDLERIKETMVTENVVDFMVSKIQRLSRETQQVLTLAACIGFRFELSTLSTIQGKPPAEVAADLREALREGLVVSVTAGAQPAGAPGKGLLAERQPSYRFLHDRVQQAAYSLVEDSRKLAMHAQIGRLLLAESDAAPRQEDLFEIVNHLNLGIALITEPAERAVLARLNLQAGRKAKAGTVYPMAVTHLRLGVSLLDEATWEDDYGLAFGLHAEQAECEVLIGQFEKAEALFDVLLRRARSNVDRTHVYNLRIALYTTIADFQAALETGRAALAISGVTLPEAGDACKAAAERELAGVRENLVGRCVEDLIDSPVMNDPDKQATLTLLANLISPAYNTDPWLYVFIVVKQVNFSLQYGNAESSPAGYATYGLVLAGLLNQAQQGYAFGKLAIGLCEKFNSATLKCNVIFHFAAHNNIFSRPIQTSLAYFAQAHQAGLESGDLIYLSYNAYHKIIARLGMGGELAAVDDEVDALLALMQRTKTPLSTAVLQVSKQLILTLTGRTPGRLSLSSADFDEGAFAATLEQPGFMVAAGWFYTAKIELLIFYGDYEAAFALVPLAEAKTATSVAFYSRTDLVLYSCLACSGVYPTRTAAEQREIAARLDGYRAQLAEWAESSPENFLHMKLFVEAEQARLDGDEIKYIDGMDRVIELTQQNGYVHHQALASEMAAKFHASRSRTRLAQLCMVDAYHAYVRWGATAKADDLAEKHPNLLLPLFATEPPQEPGREAISLASTAGPGTGGRVGALVDAAAVSRAAQAIAREIVLDKVVDRLMRIVMGNTGAQRGILMLVRDGGLMIEATTTVAPEMVTSVSAAPLEGSKELALTVVYYVERTLEPVVLGDALREDRFAGDPYITARQPKSLLCLAMVHQGKLTGILYLENNAATHVFTPDRIEIATLLSSHAAIAVENALLVARVQTSTDALQRLNEALASQVAERTDELRQANERLLGELVVRERLNAERDELHREIIRGQKERLLEMSSPIIPITDQIMVMPLIGTIDEVRALQVLETALQGARERRALVVIIDITGVRVVDSNVASTLVRTATALRLLGTQAVLTGVRPEVSETLVKLNANLDSLVTKGTLQGGIRYALRRSGTFRPSGSTRASRGQAR